MAPRALGVIRGVQPYARKEEIVEPMKYMAGKKARQQMLTSVLALASLRVVLVAAFMIVYLCSVE